MVGLVSITSIFLLIYLQAIPAEIVPVTAATRPLGQLILSGNVVNTPKTPVSPKVPMAFPAAVPAAVGTL